MEEDKNSEQRGEKPKIIVDDDWKAQAQAEKERLAEETQKPASVAGSAAPSAAGSEAPPAEAAAPAAEAPGRAREIPPASFETLVQTLAAQAMMGLGGYEDPQTHRRLVDLDLAKHMIDTLRILEEKTRGNATEEERKLLDRTVYDLRMLFVDISQRVSAAGPGS